MSERKEHGEERRKNTGLSDEAIEAIKERVLASVYEDIGRSVVKKALWIAGACAAAGAAWLGVSGHLK